jgi:hypothetical protein
MGHEVMISAMEGERQRGKSKRSGMEKFGTHSGQNRERAKVIRLSDYLNHATKARIIYTLSDESPR